MGFRLAHREAVCPDPEELTVGADAREREGRVAPTGEHELRTERHLIRQPLEDGDRSGRVQQVDVVEHEHERQRPVGDRSLPFVLVLDDVHLLHSSGSVAILERLADQMPLGSQLVLAGRSDPPLSLPRMRANGELVRIGPDSLAMSEPEAQMLLEHTGVELDGRMLESLVVQVEGWPAGLYLAAIALRESENPAAAAERFAGYDRLVADYLHDEALRTFPDELRAFLVRSSVLDRLSARVCDDVLERTDSARMLEEIDASNLFLVPLDQHGEWYRYHHLFRDMLGGELDRLDPSIESALTPQASKWWEHHGDIDAALHHA